MAYNGVPTVRSWLLGTKLKRARIARGHSVEDVAKLMGKNASTVYRNESGHTLVKGDVLEFYIEAYRPNVDAQIAAWVESEVDKVRKALSHVDPDQMTEGELAAVDTVVATVRAQSLTEATTRTARLVEEWQKETQRWRELAKLSRARGPWGASGHIVGPSYRDFADAESMSDTIRTWAPQAIPGLLQTPRYSADVISSAAEAYREGEYSVEDHRVLREQRKALLARPPTEVPQVFALVDEGAIRRMVGGPDGMRGQVEHLLALSATKAVRIQVLPFSAGSHAGLSGAFDLFYFGEDRIGFREGHGDGTFVDAEHVIVYERRWEAMQKCSLSVEETTAMMTEILMTL